ncbi:MAG: lytic transglycosylase domain-containing protein [Fimbriimonadaceae bacterium]
MNIQPMGPEGVRARMEAIRAKMEAAFPSKVQEFISGEAAPTSGLTGGIGGSKPMNPFGAGVSVAGAPTELKSLIEKAATEAGVDPALFDALIASESAYDPRARSRAGAMGLSQLMPGTARGLGVTDPFDAWQNLSGGARYLSQMMKKFGDPRTALAAYNAGPGAVEKAGGIPNYAETRAYVEKVMRLYEMKKGGG